MEESYMLHRRRKAAAKNRRETSKQHECSEELVNDDDDDGGDARAKMEKMVEDTEKLEESVGQAGKHELHKVAVDREKKVVSSPVANDAQFQREYERELKTNLPTKIETISEKNTSKNRILVCKTGGRSIAQTKMSTLGNCDESVALTKKATSPLPEQENDDTREVAAERTIASGKKYSDSKGIKIPTRLKKRQKASTEQRQKSTAYFSDDEEEEEEEEEEEDGHERWKIFPAERDKNKWDSTNDSSNIIRDDGNHDYTNNELPKKNRKKRASSRLRHSSEVIEVIDTQKHKQQFDRVSGSEDGSSMAGLESESKKQIIPLSDECLIEDLAKAREVYSRRQQNIMNYSDNDNYFLDTSQHSILSRRKYSTIHSGSEVQEILPTIVVQSTGKKNCASWLMNCFQQWRKKEKNDSLDKSESSEPLLESVSLEDEYSVTKKVSKIGEVRTLFRGLGDLTAEFKEFVRQNPRQVNIICEMRNRCLAELIMMIIYCGTGAFLFRFTEGAFETFYKCGVKRVKRDFLDSLWTYSHNLREDDWKSLARKKLMEFEEQLHAAHEAGVHSYSGQKSWTFLNAVVYCLTVITTIGYGHIAPTTTTGRAITIVYAIFGIPMFLIILADFGKLFTRGIKFLWAFIRRLYYTGSCRKVRRTGTVQEVMKGVQLVYDFATFRRPSQMNPEEIEEIQKHGSQTQSFLTVNGNFAQGQETISVPDTPATPNMSAYAIDDEFNLPISVAISILLGYIFVGATLYHFWEKEWSFFESFYFVFISMSTIGFGDYVPTHPIYMMCSIVYLVFGLALTSMCINVVQVMLSDQFKHASQKIGATIGFEVVESDGSIQQVQLQPIEVPDIHTSGRDSVINDGSDLKVKQENVES